MSFSSSGSGSGSGSGSSSSGSTVVKRFIVQMVQSSLLWLYTKGIW